MNCCLFAIKLALVAVINSLDSIKCSTFENLSKTFFEKKNWKVIINEIEETRNFVREVIVHRIFLKIWPAPQKMFRKKFSSKSKKKSSKSKKVENLSSHTKRPFFGCANDHNEFHSSKKIYGISEHRFRNTTAMSARLVCNIENVD